MITTVSECSLGSSVVKRQLWLSNNNLLNVCSILDINSNVVIACSHTLLIRYVTEATKLDFIINVRGCKSSS